MRSAQRIARTPREHRDAQRHEREQTLEALLAELRKARSSGAEWYRWIAGGCQPLSEAEYAATNPAPRSRGRRGAAAAS